MTGPVELRPMVYYGGNLTIEPFVLGGQLITWAAFQGGSVELELERDECKRLAMYLIERGYCND